MKKNETRTIFFLIFRKSLKIHIEWNLVQKLNFLKKTLNLNKRNLICTKNSFFRKPLANLINWRIYQFSKFLFFFSRNFNIVDFHSLPSRERKFLPCKFYKERFTSTRCFLLEHRDFREVFIPHFSSKKFEEKNFKKQYLPKWIGSFFKNLKEFNYIQTIIFPVSIGTDVNLLICAPTGTGKTNIALFSIIRTILNSIRFKISGKKITKSLIKILYLAPMRSLVKEIGKNFHNLFNNKGLEILEVTGDSDISKNDIESANILIGTPEKVDIFSRKEKPILNFSDFKLLIVDEIHLLNEKRGSILEEILIRFLTHTKNKKSRIRIIGLSATLPNYHDIGKFLNVNPLKGVFYFGSNFRPVFLNKTIIGLKKSLNINRGVSSFNEVLFSLMKKIFLKNSSQNLIIFVHSRRDTIRTGNFLAQKLCVLKNFKKNEDLKKRNYFIKKLQMIKSNEIKNLVRKGIGIHHAGLSKNDRNIIEDFFREGYLNIIISTATLAWGLNLPATHVIIKGTKVYSPEKSSWVEIPDFNVIQMLGRAGRILNSKFSEGIVLTTMNNLSHYIDLFTNQMPIESRLLTSLPDCLNTECNGKRIFDIFSALNWFSKTFMWIRLERTIKQTFSESNFEKKKNWLTSLENIFISESLNELIGAGMVLLNKENGVIKSTPFGKIGSSFNVSYQTIVLLLSELSYNSTYFEIFRLISLSSEFSSFHLRKGENAELSRLENLIFFSSKEDSLSQVFKVNTLLQSYIGKLIIKNLSLEADSIFIGRTGLRISRALFEISVSKRLVKLSHNCFRIYRAIKSRIWEDRDVPPQFFSSLIDNKKNRDSKKTTFDIDLLGGSDFQKSKESFFPKKKSLATRKNQKFPSLIKISYFLQPVTRNTIRLHFVFFFEFILNGFIGKKGIGLWFFVEDQIYDTLVFFSFLRIKKKKIGKRFHFSIQIPISDNPPSPYFRLRIVPDKLMGSDLEFSIDLTQLVFPENFQMETTLLKVCFSTPVRLFSGFQGGQVLTEYFLTHFQQFNPFFVQISPYILKKTGKKIFIDNEKSLRLNFMEISILSYFLSNRSLVGFFLSCGGESINLKLVQIRKSSASILGLPVSKFKKRTRVERGKRTPGKIFFIISLNDYNSFKDKILKNSRKNLVFFTDFAHLIGDWNFGNSIEEVLDQIKNSYKKFERFYFSGSLLPVSNSWDLFQWLRISMAEGFCQKLKIKPIGKKRNRSFIFKNMVFEPNKKNFLIISSNSHNLKKKVILFFFSFLAFFIFKNSKSFLARKKYSHTFCGGGKIQKLFSFLKIGLFNDSDNFNHRRLIQELNISKKLKGLFLTIGSLANISLETLVGKRVIWSSQTNKVPGVGFFSPKIFLLKERCKSVQQIGKESISFDNENVTLESLWDIWFVEKILNFLNREKVLKKKDFHNYFLGSFFCHRLFQNPNFYCISNEMVGNFSTKNFLFSVLNVLNDKKYIIPGHNKTYQISKKNQNFFKFGQFQKWFFISYFSSEINIESFDTLKKISREHFCDILRINPIFFWFLDKKFLKKRPIFNNEKGISFFKKKENQIEVITFEIKVMVSLLIKYYRFKRTIRPILYFIEFTQLIWSGNPVKKSNLYKFFNQENLAPFLMGKIHGIFFKKSLSRLIFSPSNLIDNEIPKKHKEIFFRDHKSEHEIYVKFSMLKKKNRKIIKFDFGFSINNSFPDLSNLLSQNQKFINKDPIFWWIIIGDQVSNQIFLCKKMKNFTNLHVEIGFLLKKSPREIKIFAINENWSDLDKEAKFLFA